MQKKGTDKEQPVSVQTAEQLLASKEISKADFTEAAKKAAKKHSSLLKRLKDV